MHEDMLGVVKMKLKNFLKPENWLPDPELIAGMIGFEVEEFDIKGGEDDEETGHT